MRDPAKLEIARSLAAPLTPSERTHFTRQIRLLAKPTRERWTGGYPVRGPAALPTFVVPQERLLALTPIGTGWQSLLMARSTEMAFAIIFTPHLVALLGGPRGYAKCTARDGAPGAQPVHGWRINSAYCDGGFCCHRASVCWQGLSSWATV
jgi:hypothetical protein